MRTITRSPGYAKEDFRSEIVELLREGAPLGRGGPTLTADMLRALSEEIAHRPPGVFSFASTSMGSALVQVGHVLEWSLTAEPRARDAMILSVAVTWDLGAIQALAPAVSSVANHVALQRPVLSVNLSFRPFAITSLLVAAPGSLILQRAS